MFAIYFVLLYNEILRGIFIRIISGKARGTRLFSPTNEKTRPTSDFVKESLFNILGADVINANFLDIFAGSGAIGIEALSRGASSAVFIESSAAAIALIRRNLNKTKLEDCAKIIGIDYKKALTSLSGQTFDIVFLDPPYKQNLVQSVLEIIMQASILVDTGILIAEMAKNTCPSEELVKSLGLEIYKIRQYSATELVFFKPVT